MITAFIFFFFLVVIVVIYEGAIGWVTGTTTGEGVGIFTGDGTTTTGDGVYALTGT